MKTISSRIAPRLALAATMLAVPLALAASPDPCKILPAATWGGIMGYEVVASPGDGYCTYHGKGGGGQFRIMASSGTAADAAATVKRMRDHQAGQHGTHDSRMNTLDSQGDVVFSIALFQEGVSEGTAVQLQKLVAVVKQHLPK